MPTLTGTYHLPDGQPAQGTIEIIPSEKVILDLDDNVVLSGRVKVALNQLGSFSVVLPATDDVTLNPTGFGYTVVAKLHHTHVPAVSFSLPAAVATVDITDVTDVDPSLFEPGVTYATADDITTHASDTTSVHGIADTTALVVTTDPRLSDARTPTAHAHTYGDISGTIPDGDLPTRLWGLDLCLTADPRMPATAGAWPGANRCIFARVMVGGVAISKVGFEVTTASGNVSVAAYRNTGVGRAAAPGERLATSGAVACPAVGYAELSLGATVTVYPGDWLALTCDNTTAAFARFPNPTGAATILGLLRRQDTAHPAPATVGTLAASSYMPVLVGAP